MSETPTLCESSVNEPKIVSSELELNAPEFVETPIPAVEVGPVSWDGPQDPTNPQNWPEWRKWLVMSVNAIITVNVYVLRVMFSVVKD